MALESLLKYYKTVTWNDLVSSLSHHGISLVNGHEPIIRKYLEKKGYHIEGDQSSLPDWKAVAPTQTVKAKAGHSKDDINDALDKVLG